MIDENQNQPTGKTEPDNPPPKVEKKTVPKSAAAVKKAPKKSVAKPKVKKPAVAAPASPVPPPALALVIPPEKEIPTADKTNVFNDAMDGVFDTFGWNQS